MFDKDDYRRVIALKYQELGWNYRITFGKDRGKELIKLDKKYLRWLVANTGLIVNEKGMDGLKCTEKS